jgi:NAD+ kinase
MNKIGILYHPLSESARTLAEHLQKVLMHKGKSAWSCSALDETTAIKRLNGTELILSVGGDGTILRAAQVALTGQIPITGINMGNLGFMTEMTANEAETGLFDILEGKGWLDERAMLEAGLKQENGSNGTYYALNDVVLARGNVVRIVSIEAEINGENFTTYRADGVILSTATGSTGYSLSAGGPILHHGAREILLTPLLSHLSPAYSLVLPGEAIVRLVIKTLVPGTLSIDGHINLEVKDNAIITIKQSKHVTKFLRLHAKDSFYSTLEQKLKGKQSR